MKKVSVIIPSRSQPLQLEFLSRAISSIRNQDFSDNHLIEILVCLDKDSFLDEQFIKLKNIKCIQSKGESQAAALNAGINFVSDGYIAFLEDDDEWTNNFLSTAFKAIEHAQFISSTQLEYDENQEILRINDFPTPSGWFMKVEVLQTIGEFNENYKYHLDNEWLGRLAESSISRGHLIECTAPKDSKYLNIRPWLLNVLTYGGLNINLLRHNFPYPLVRRFIHSRSGMAQINTNPHSLNISKIEQNNLHLRFGHIPW